MSRHSLSIGIERVGDEFFLALRVVGKLTHADYEIINPLIDSALAGISTPKIKVLVDATELEGWELRAAWDDFQLGLKHDSEFDKIAIYGNKKWHEYTAKIGSWFISGDVKFFQDYDAALQWLQDDS
jgi:hypothetical protein